MQLNCEQLIVEPSTFVLLFLFYRNWSCYRFKTPTHSRSYCKTVLQYRYFQTCFSLLGTMCRYGVQRFSLMWYSWQFWKFFRLCSGCRLPAVTGTAPSATIWTTPGGPSATARAATLRRRTLMTTAQGLVNCFLIWTLLLAESKIFFC